MARGRGARRLNDEGGILPPGRVGSEVSPTVLAYVGDAVYETLIRTMMLDLLLQSPAGVQTDRLHQEVARFVTAPAQARLLAFIWPDLTEEEHRVARQGRNARLRHRPAGAGYRTYRRSTALETLVGYLYLEGRTQRLVGLIRVGVERVQGGTAAPDPQR